MESTDVNQHPIKASTNGFWKGIPPRLIVQWLPFEPRKILKKEQEIPYFPEKCRNNAWRYG